MAAASKPSVLLSSSSSSSPSISHKPDTKPRNSESSDPMRRSFGGNPFPTGKPTVLAHRRGFHNPNPTPANSPSSDFPRKSSTRRESDRRESADKENEKIQSSNIVRGPPTPKVTKNFMSPTISAVSKINASPKSKILTEKNEKARSFVSFSDVVSIIGENEEESKPLMDVEDLYDMTVTDLDQKEAFELKNGSGCSFEISPRSTVSYPSPVVEPLNANNPSMPPYDPKKNYLSPRPQFLHYRPYPRIEHFVHESKQLEDIFTSESSSDTEVSKEESHSENSDASQEVESGPNEKKVVEEKEEKEEKEEEEEEKDDDDVVHDEEMEAHEEMECEDLKADHISKSRCFTALKFIGWLLVLAVTFFFVSTAFFPQSELSVRVYSDLPDFYIPVDFKESAQTNFEQFGEKLRTWSESSRAYVAKLISSLGEEEEEQWLRFQNSTDLWEESSLDSVFQQAKAEISVADDYQEPEEASKHESKGENTFEVISEVDKDADPEAIESHEEYEAERSEHVQEKLEMTETVDDTYNDMEVFEVTGSDNGFPEEIRDDKWIGEGKKESETFSEQDVDVKTREFLEVETETSKVDAQKPGRIESTIKSEDLGFFDDYLTVEADNELENDREISESEISAESDQIPQENLSMNQNVAVLSLTVTAIVLGAASAYLLTKKPKPMTIANGAGSASEPTPVAEELRIHHVPVENLIKERFSSLNLQTEIVDRTRDAEESYEATTGSKKKTNSKKSSKSLTCESSSASSASEYSIGSASFGSFTTYERIPLKNLHGDEEEVMITPVRRSSRIRNQHSAQ